MKTVKIKILFVITKSRWGGAQRYLYDLTTHLPRQIFRVSVALGGDGPLMRRLTGARIKVFSLRTLDRDVSLSRDILAILELWRLMRRERPNIVHLNSSKGGVIGVIAARLARVPHIVFTAHGWAFNEKRTLMARIIIKLLQWFTVLLSETTICVSEATARDLTVLPFVGNKLTVIRNGIDGLRFLSREEARRFLTSRHPHLVEVLRRRYTSGNIHWIGAVAELHRNKGLSYAIDAVATLERRRKELRLPPFVFIVIGEGDERKSLASLIKEKDLGSAVFLLGEVEDAAIYLKAFNLFILPSVTEGFPYSLLEAGAASLPTLASAVGGIGELIEDMKSGILVKPRSPREIEHAIAYLLSNPHQCRSFGRALKMRVEDEFRLRRMVEETVSIYNALVQLRTSPSEYAF